MLGLIAIVVAGVAHVSLAADTQSDLEKRGEALINARCIACHSTKSLIKFVARCAEQRGDAYWTAFSPAIMHRMRAHALPLSPI